MNEHDRLGITPDQYAQLVELYRAHKYAFPAPPVQHTRWSEADWIRYVYRCGGFSARVDFGPREITRN